MPVLISRDSSNKALLCPIITLAPDELMPSKFGLFSSPWTTTRYSNTRNQWDMASVADESVTSSTVGLSSDKKFDRVRWLIDQQSFNGAWVFSEQDVLTLNNQKPFDAFKSTVSQAKEALHTALAIVVLESRHADQKNLWNAIVHKGRKQLQSSGLTVAQVNRLIDEIKKQLE